MKEQQEGKQTGASHPKTPCFSMHAISAAHVTGHIFTVLREHSQWA